MDMEQGGNSINLAATPVSQPFAEDNKGETAQTTAVASQDEKGQQEGDTTKDAPSKEGANSVSQDSHRMVIDLIEEKFNSMQGEELKNWFSGHKEFGDIANRSKRLKERYRSLMNTQVSTIPDQPKDAKQASKESKAEDDLVTKAEMLKILDEHSERKVESSLRRERQASAERFASEHSILDEEYNRFRKTADVLYEANNEWSYDQALAAAHRALYNSKSKGVNLSGTTSTASSGGTIQVGDSVDLSKGFTINLGRK